MIRRAVDIVLRSGIRPVIVVTGHEAESIAAALDGLPVVFAHAEDYADGMSASLRAAITAVPETRAGALICLGDMPFVRAETLDRLVEAFDPDAGHIAVIPSFDGERGNPVLLGRALFGDIGRLTGDQGARPLLAAAPGRVVALPVDDPGILRDIDRPDALMT